MDFDNDGVGTWYIRKEDVDSLPLKMVFANRERRHGVSIVYVSTELQGVVAYCLDCLDDKVVCPSYVPMNT